MFGRNALYISVLHKWEQFLVGLPIYLWSIRPAAPNIHSIQFPIIFGADFFTQKWLPLQKSACIRTCFIEESLYSLPIFDLEFWTL